MNPPRIARRRGIFFAPMWIFGFIVLAALLMAINVWRSASTTTYIVLRHAEKQLGTIDDPPLSAEGLARANRLADLLVTARSSVGQVQAIYASDTHRAEQTATPLAQRLGISIQRYPGRDVQALVDRIQRDHAGGVVLVVGHSNTVPEIVAAASHGRFKSTAVSLADDDFGSIFVVTSPSWAPAALLRLHY